MTVMAIDQSVAVPEEVELRCPETAGKLLAKIRRQGEQPSYVHPDNLIELSCDSCKLSRRRAGLPVVRVLHRYDILGTLVATLVVE
jgi:hypothetical protein